MEAVFAGHVHNFWYDRVGQADFYMLPSTAFLRHDFSEFYRVEPGPEFGRGDVEKFGYFVVDVFEDGHVAYCVRTHGERLSATDAPAPPRTVHLAHPKTSTFDNIGVELRHPWAESMQISATGGVQEFGRKWARNDYPLLALWEMGGRLSKIPDIDLAEPTPRERMKLMARLGHRYIVTSVGRPKEALTREEAEQAGVAAFEVNATLEDFKRQKAALREWRQTTGTQVYFSKIHTFDDSHFDGKHFSHFVKAGFTLAELDEARDIVREAAKASAIDGITVRVEAEEDLLEATARLVTFAEEAQALVLVSLKTSGPNLATERAGDRDFVGRVAQAMVMSKTSARVRYVFDTFMDVDRGYFPRHTFIDRRFNARPAARAYATLSALLSPADRIVVEREADGLRFTVDGRQYRLVCGDARQSIARIRAASPGAIVYDLIEDKKTSCQAGAAALERAAVSGNEPQALLIQWD